MDLKLILTIVLSLGVVTAILGLTMRLMSTSKKAEKSFKGIPEKARKWMRAESILGWMSLGAFLVLIFKPVQPIIILFMVLLGAYFMCYGIAVYLAERLEDLGFGPTYYGKAARWLGTFIFIFGLSIFATGIAGLFL